MLLLDTHVWIWGRQGDADRIGRATQRLLGRAETGNLLYVSPISVFEVTTLHGMGRVRFSSSLESSSIDTFGFKWR